jgi:hypothetical protein
MSRKAQIEILGLAFVVILITLAFLFVVAFLIRSSESPAMQVSRDRIFAMNFVNTYLGTTSDCNERTVKELIKDCAQGAYKTCPSGRTTCAEAAFILDEVAPDSLDLFYPVNYAALTQQSAVIFERNSPCPGEQVFGYADIPLFGQSVTMELALCR